MARDLRRYARQTNTRLILGGILLLFLVGDGLIYLIYGRGPALMGLVCLAAGLSPLLLIWLVLSLLEWIVRRADRE
jgi:hypothetical protein